MCLLRISAPLWSFSWRRNGKYYNVARDPQASMRRRSGTLDIYAWNNPEQYEAEYQCIASNEYGSAYSNKIRLRLYSKITTEALRGPMDHHCCCTDSRHTMPSVSRVTHTFFCQYPNTLFHGFTQMEFDFFCIWFAFTFYEVQFCYSLDMLKQLKYLLPVVVFCLQEVTLDDILSHVLLN